MSNTQPVCIHSFQKSKHPTGAFVCVNCGRAFTYPQDKEDLELNVTSDSENHYREGPDLRI